MTNDPCKHCGACRNPEICQCCGACRNCGKHHAAAKSWPPAVQSPQFVPYPVPVPTYIPGPVPQPWEITWHSNSDRISCAGGIHQGICGGTVTLSGEAQGAQLAFGGGPANAAAANPMAGVLSPHAGWKSWS